MGQGSLSTKIYYGKLEDISESFSRMILPAADNAVAGHM